MERLVLFAKTPRLNEVKTRLASFLTPQQALLLHESMLVDQLRFVESLVSEGRSCEVSLDRPLDAGSPLNEAGRNVFRTFQGDGDLGARMNRAQLRAFADGVSRVAILGADAPTVPSALVEDAFARIALGADAVVIPALDGGYVLVGASRPVPDLFDAIEWGTPGVLDATRRRAREAGIVLAETEPWSDVDVGEDLPRLLREMAADPKRAPATAACLAGLRLYSR